MCLWLCYLLKVTCNTVWSQLHIHALLSLQSICYSDHRLFHLLPVDVVDVRFRCCSDRCVLNSFSYIQHTVSGYFSGICVHICVFKEVSVVWKAVCSPHFIIHKLGNITVFRFCISNTGRCDRVVATSYRFFIWIYMYFSVLHILN